MTPDKAIFILKRDNPNNIAIRSGFEDLYDQRNEAFSMAIEALEQELVLDKIRDEIKQEYKDECEHPYGQGLRRAIEIIDKYKAESEE